ncbi:hypothetical protein ACET3Z_025589 [Daucus carota]
MKKAISVDEFDLEEEEQQQAHEAERERVGGWGAWGSRRGRMPMELDDDDMFADGAISDHRRVRDTDFYNSFDDDFDDHDIN